jgi:hypothetical protein
MRHRQRSTGAAGSVVVPLCAIVGAALLIISCLNPLTDDFPSSTNVGDSPDTVVVPIPVVPDPSDQSGRPDMGSGGGLANGEGEPGLGQAGVGDAGAAEPDGSSPDAGDEGGP